LFQTKASATTKTRSPIVEHRVGLAGIASEDDVAECRCLRPGTSSPGAQKHLFHISSTKGLRPGIYASMMGDPIKAILKFCNFTQQPGGASKYPINVTLNSQFEYIFQTCLKMFSIGVEVRILNS